MKAKRLDVSEDMDLPTLLNRLGDGWRGAEKLIGNKNAVELPSAADPLAGDFYSKLGAPDDATGYKVERPELPQDMAYDENLEAKVLEVAAEHKLLPQQLQPLISLFADHQKEAHEQIAAASAADLKSTTEALKKDWGGEYDGNLSLAKAAAAHLGLYDDQKQAEAIDTLETTVGGPGVLRMMHRIGTMLGEDVLTSGGAAGGFGTSPADAKATLKELKLDTGFQEALRNPRDPGHKEAVAKRAHFYKIAYPS